jgi:hypothetical protein
MDILVHRRGYIYEVDVDEMPTWNQIDKASRLY